MNRYMEVSAFEPSTIWADRALFALMIALAVVVVVSICWDWCRSVRQAFRPVRIDTE